MSFVFWSSARPTVPRNLANLPPHFFSPRWGFGSTTAFPIFGAWVANKTMDLRLPPLDNLLIMNTEADRCGGSMRVLQRKEGM